VGRPSLLDEVADFGENRVSNNSLSSVSDGLMKLFGAVSINQFRGTFGVFGHVWEWQPAETISVSNGRDQSVQSLQ
jgi:hypothetical protein